MAWHGRPSDVNMDKPAGPPSGTTGAFFLTCDDPAYRNLSAIDASRFTSGLTSRPGDNPRTVIAGLAPAIHAFVSTEKIVDDRRKACHDR
jgi:hypothetical protein